MSVSIKISGPGETMAAEIFIIRRALSDAGYKVTINDKYPCDDKNHIYRVLGMADKATVHIKVDHLPWGG